MSSDKTQRDLMNNERFKNIYVHASQEPWLPFYPGSASNSSVQVRKRAIGPCS